jgi:hypothetical protein
MEKNSLTFDMPEPLGFFIDFAVIQLIQPGKMEKKDFIKKISVLPQPVLKDDLKENSLHALIVCADA